MIVRAPFERPYGPGDSLDFSRPLVWTTPVLEPGVCAALIERVERIGFSEAPINSILGFERRPDIRNNDRVIFDDPVFAQEMYEAVRPTLPDGLNGGMRHVGANERLRCYRYTAGQRFAPHHDGSFRRDRREESLLTFMVYLNADFRGGATHFLDLATQVTPETGLGLLFQHWQLHEGCVVEEGVKYVLRTDVMFRR